MKRAIICLGCGKIKRKNESYKVRVERVDKMMLTGEVKRVEYEGRMCRECSRQAGYKVRADKKKRR